MTRDAILNTFIDIQTGIDIMRRIASEREFTKIEKENLKLLKQAVDNLVMNI